MENSKHPAGHCPRCGQPLPKDTPEGLCAACLFEAGAETITATLSSSREGSAPSSSESQRLISGQTWGPYRIGKLLGRGGMGEVYESEQMESGRRIALKVLRDRLQDADQRARFLREGQLAASVSHPHTVYIFGSEEISGIPVISMELLPGGTLKDRVAAQGPMPSNEAVSAILDIIGGLDAAQAAGILHRDIKPSNCFLDSEGVVKVGDFGLSISTLARDVHRDVSASGFQGTPQFAAPEQLRGEPLDLRADVYAVGATLYYLLTGQPPFDSRDLRDLMAKVTTEPPKSPRLLRPEIPSGLASVVLECLAKTPSQRPASYAALADALRPFSSAGNAPARIGMRLLAGVIDSFILSMTVLVLASLMGSPLSPWSSAETMGWTGVLLLVYFLLEGFWGATPGKRLFGLRVTSVDGGIASWGRIAYRHILFDLPTFILWLIPLTIAGAARYDAFVATNPVFITAASVASLAVLGAYFLTARRHNGWAALHDLASATRLVAIRGSEERRLSTATGSSPLPGEHSAAAGLHYGPFTAVFDIGAADDDRLIIGFDPALRRTVWIRTLPPGAPTIMAARRDVSRAGRLHWLTGRRSAEENWDAFEAPDGEPFLAHRNPTSWPTMKLWLLDLANELQAAIQEQSLPRLGLDRLWIRNDGRLVLLDFPAVSDERPTPANAQDLTPMGLLSAVADHTLSQDRNAPPAVPLTARSMIDRWSGPTPPALGEARTSLAGFLSTLDRVPKWRRAIPFTFAILPFLLVVAAALLVGALAAEEKGEILILLELLSDKNPSAASPLTDPEYRAAVERYLVGRYGASLRDDAFWNDPLSQTIGLPPLRGIAVDVASRHPSVSADELARATTIVVPPPGNGKGSQGENLFVGIAFMAASTSLFVIGWSLVSSAILPGGLVMRILGLAVVTKDGKEIRRWRSVARILAAGSPMMVWIAALVLSVRFDVHLGIASWFFMALAFLLPMIGAAWAIVQPTQGLHDRAMGTWVVPR